MVPTPLTLIYELPSPVKVCVSINKCVLLLSLTSSHFIDYDRTKFCIPAHTRKHVGKPLELSIQPGEVLADFLSRCGRNRLFDAEIHTAWRRIAGFSVKVYVVERMISSESTMVGIYARRPLHQGCASSA